MCVWGGEGARRREGLSGMIRRRSLGGGSNSNYFISWGHFGHKGHIKGVKRKSAEKVCTNWVQGN